MQVILIRHGETAPNRDSIVLGREDVPLTEVGLLQARALAARLHQEMARGLRIHAIYSSPLDRARLTAAPIAEITGIPVIEAPDLIEMDIGEMEGLQATEMRARHPEFMREWSGPNVGDLRMPGGESLAEVQARAWGALEAIRDAHSPDEAVVAVSHNFVIRSLVCRALAIPLSDFRRFDQALASMTRIDFRGPRTIVTTINETCHLGALTPPGP